jgi:Flp pilus assembly protein TadG
MSGTGDLARVTSSAEKGSNHAAAARGRRVPAGFRSGERGASLIEFALTFPVAILMFTGILVFGVYLNKQLALTNATSEGAQLLAISRGSGFADPCAEFLTAFKDVAPNINPANLTLTFSFAGNAASGTTCKSDAAFMTQGANVLIQVSYPCALAVYGKNFVPSCTLKAQIQEIVQ